MAKLGLNRSAFKASDKVISKKYINRLYNRKDNRRNIIKPLELINTCLVNGF